ncbi:MAG: Mg2 transporter protein CorA family protein [Parcubacteria group bacterium GW2011_GWF2_39_13b]|nr:MAG: Mg2 transporter protein CorA family protein [Parcubacteria group bacterium GW2011_GWF2_39_13b]
MIKFYHKTIKDPQPNILDEFKIGSWIYVENPNAQELKNISQNFNLELGHLQDALDPLEVPRLEIEQGIVYIFTRLPYKENGKITTCPALIVLGEAFVLTISAKPLSFLEKFTKGTINFNTTQKTKLILQICSEIISSYNHLLTEIGRVARGSLVDLEKIDNKDIIQLVITEATLNDFLTALIPTNAILNNLLSANFSVKALELYEEDKNLIEDLFLSTGQLIELCKGTLKTSVNIREAYSTIMTNNLNRVIKFFTALTVIMTIPMIVGGFYGMNIKLPFGNHPLAFFGVIGVTILIIATILTIFVKKKWI